LKTGKVNQKAKISDFQRVKAINLVPESHDYSIATGEKPGLLHIAQVHKAQVAQTIRF
jgi:hypothetical protein